MSNPVTHHEGCWRYHIYCAIAEIERLRLKVAAWEERHRTRSIVCCQQFDRCEDACAPLVHHLRAELVRYQETHTALMKNADEMLFRAGKVDDAHLVYPEGCTPLDIEVLRKTNTDFAAENQRLKTALRFYAHGHHWECEGQARLMWDTVSGEPQNWHYRENETDDAEGIEDGKIAKRTLLNQPIDWEGEEPPYIEGEPEYEASKAVDEPVTHWTPLPAAPEGK